jgi:hypothetical protein
MYCIQLILTFFVKVNGSHSRAAVKKMREVR